MKYAKTEKRKYTTTKNSQQPLLSKAAIGSAYEQIWRAKSRQKEQLHEYESARNNDIVAFHLSELRYLEHI